ncbi:MAG: hypothetical protein CMH55_00975 [Myxococcales bacterium]|nr:hypothetical protein [Myxococcales bacterium]
MNDVILIGSALPSFFLAHMIYKADRYKEPIGKFIFAFVIGVLSPIVTLFFSGMFAGIFPVESNAWTLALLGAGVPEELGRFLILLLLCKVWKDVNEPFDCVVYAAAIWAGFAAVENVLYAVNFGAQGESPLFIIAMRAALCSTGHTAWGVIVGAYVGMAMFGKGNKIAWALKGLGIAIILHTVYDGLLFSVKDGGAAMNGLWAVVVDGVTLVMAVLIVLRMSRIQSFSDGEGQNLMMQVRLMRRFRPDRGDGVNQLAKGLGVLGVIQILLVLFFAATTYFAALLLASGVYLAVIGGAITGALGYKTWGALWRRIELTEAADAPVLAAEAGTQPEDEASA